MGNPVIELILSNTGFNWITTGSKEDEEVIIDNIFSLIIFKYTTLGQLRCTRYFFFLLCEHWQYIVILK